MKALSKVLTYPLERDNWLLTTIIGGVLLFFGFLIVPMLLVYGYVVFVLRASLAGESEPPKFENWGSLLVEGLKAWVIGLVYMLVPLAVGVVTIGGSIAAFTSGGDAAAPVGVGGFFLGFALTFLVALVFGYVAVAGVVNFAREERLGAGFDVGVLRKVLLEKEYATAWFVSVLIVLVSSVVNAVPLIGFLVGPFVAFYVTVAAANLWADGFEKALAA